MYAVIKTGGKQYKVTQGETIEVEHLVVKGDKTSFTPILVVTDDGETIYGAKALKDFTVSATVVGDTKGDKLTVFKYRSKSGYAQKTGHRQMYSMIEITSIGAKDKKAEPAKAPAAEPEPEPEPQAETKD
ncbi:MAG: 50S ribosomal protein L21 [Actinomycetota bacterium]|nr:50S ribosomal protein L21 [Actinomycetota bacterium]